MQIFEVGNRDHFKYISFCHTSSDIKICSLYINEVNNVEVWYELLYEADIMEKVVYQEREGTLRDTILEIEYKRQLLFTGVEQASKKKLDSVFVLITPNLRKEAQYWIRENYGKSLVFVDGKTDYKTSVLSLPSHITIYSNKLNEFVKSSMASKYVLKVNNFGNKYKSFTAALTESDSKIDNMKRKILIKNKDRK